jgi:antitoxin component HigA of HigAB toxin-antitoxin module
MEIRSIKNDADYEAALAEIDVLLECVPGSPDANGLGVLGVLFVPRTTRQQTAAA